MGRRHSTALPFRNGFTLIEVLVVVAILGMILTIGVPGFVRALHKEGMRKAESDVMEACQKARGGAIIKASKQTLVFHPLDKSFEAPGAFPLTVLPSEVNIVAFSMNGEEYAPEDYDVVTVNFYPKGTSDEFAIILRSATDGSQCTISLDEVTGLADISTSK
jgi:prepilin-type N-terminal cleavage/methylation domain-containing protein